MLWTYKSTSAKAGDSEREGKMNKLCYYEYWLTKVRFWDKAMYSTQPCSSLQLSLNHLTSNRRLPLREAGSSQCLQGTNLDQGTHVCSLFFPGFCVYWTNSSCSIITRDSSFSTFTVTPNTPWKILRVVTLVMALSLWETQLCNINHSRYTFNERLGTRCKYLFKQGQPDPGTERGRGLWQQKSHYPAAEQ